MRRCNSYNYVNYVQDRKQLGRHAGETMNKQNKKHDRDKVKLVPSCSEMRDELWDNTGPLHTNHLPKMAFALQCYHLIITRKIEWQSLIVPMVSAAERLFLLLVLSVVVELWAKALLARTNTAKCCL